MTFTTTNESPIETRMIKSIRKTVVAVATFLTAGAALADITIGVTLPLSGPASGLGLPMQNEFKIWPSTIAG
jgi:branched-chain amino acid transport system substrate-binding protein